MLSKIVIEQVINSQLERLQSMDMGLERKVSGYEHLSTHAFIVTGIRRCGKSTLLQQINRSVNGLSIYLNFEDPRLAGFDLGDFNRIHEIAQQNKINIYFLDEVQLVDKWESFVRFRLDEQDRVFISGSNSFMLSRELGSKPTGRHISRELFPFSYAEFLTYNQIEANANSSMEYMLGGGFPEFVKTKQQEILMQCFNDIITRDIVLRYNIKNSLLLKQLGVWLVSNVGKPVSGNSLKKMFGIASSSSIMEYLSFFADAYMFFYVPKFSYSQKVQTVNPKKVYCNDNGFITTNSVSFSEDMGRLLENMVFMHLRRYTNEIFYFNEGKECDFIVFSRGKIKDIIQVCYQVDQSNMEREIAGAMQAMEFFNHHKS
ncbi:MAG: ATP-binding protein, partial [Bacteroidota bacterium]